MCTAAIFVVWAEGRAPFNKHKKLYRVRQPGCAHCAGHALLFVSVWLSPSLVLQYGHGYVVRYGVWCGTVCDIACWYGIMVVRFGEYTISGIEIHGM